MQRNEYLGKSHRYIKMVAAGRTSLDRYREVDVVVDETQTIAFIVLLILLYLPRHLSAL